MFVEIYKIYKIMYIILNIGTDVQGLYFAVENGDIISLPFFENNFWGFLKETENKHKILLVIITIIPFKKYRNFK